MLIVLSPSKTLDYETDYGVKEFTQPALLSESKILAGELKGYSAKKLGTLMSISEKLAKLNYERYQDFAPPFSLTNARQALLAFKGDVYEGIEVEKYKKADFAFAQDHVRILSGLYGVLRPLDLMQPYRLEMGTTLKNPRGKNLYEFWGDRVSKELNKALKDSGSDTLINLASGEYFKAVDPKAFRGQILTISFKEKRGNKLQIIGLLAKKARGNMTNYIVKERLENPEKLKKYKEDGYLYEPDLSDADNYVFVR